MSTEKKYIPINDKGDFIEKDCLFMAHGILYAYAGVIHDDQKVFGYKVSMVDAKEYKFDFKEVGTIFKPHNCW